MILLKKKELVDLIKQHDIDEGANADICFYNWQDKTANDILEALAKALNIDFNYEIKDGFLINLDEKNKDLQKYWLAYSIFSNDEEEVALINSNGNGWNLEDRIVEHNGEKGICLISKNLN